MQLRRGLLEISEADFLIVAKAMGINNRLSVKQKSAQPETLKNE
jgi:hypothetical protein